MKLELLKLVDEKAKREEASLREKLMYEDDFEIVDDPYLRDHYEDDLVNLEERTYPEDDSFIHLPR